MSPIHDDGNEMGATDILADDVIEAFLAGEPHPGWQEDFALAAVDEALAEILARSAPPVGPKLASFVHAAPRPEAVGEPVPSWAPVPGRPPALHPASPVTTPFMAPGSSSRRPRRRLAAVVAGGAALVATAMPVAAATHLLPEPARQVVTSVLEAVTPFDFEASPVPTSTVPPLPPAATTTSPAVPASGGSASDQSGAPSSGLPAPAAGVPAVVVPPAGGGAATTPPGIVPGPPSASDAPGSAGRAVAGQTPAGTAGPARTGLPATSGPPASAGLDRAGRAVGDTPAGTGAPPAGGPPFNR